VRSEQHAADVATALDAEDQQIDAQKGRAAEEGDERQPLRAMSPKNTDKSPQRWAAITSAV